MAAVRKSRVLLWVGLVLSLFGFALIWSHNAGIAVGVFFAMWGQNALVMMFKFREQEAVDRMIREGHKKLASIVEESRKRSGNGEQ